MSRLKRLWGIKGDSRFCTRCGVSQEGGEFCSECGAPRSNPSEESPVETWTEEETAFERTAKEELVEEDKEDLMPFPEDEASA